MLTNGCHGYINAIGNQLIYDNDVRKVIDRIIVKGSITVTGNWFHKVIRSYNLWIIRSLHHSLTGQAHETTAGTRVLVEPVVTS